MDKIQAIKKFRDLTNMGLKESKDILEAHNFDIEAAIAASGETYRNRAIKKSVSDRSLKEGAVVTYEHFNKRWGGMLALNCETDFVARRQDFIEYARNILNSLMANIDLFQSDNVYHYESLKDILMIDERKLSDYIIDITGKFGEKIEVSRFVIFKAGIEEEEIVN